MKKILKQSKIDTNEYGNVDIRDKVPKGLTHIPKAKYGVIRIKKICEDMGCPYAPAYVGCEKNFGFWKPIYNGIVIPANRRRSVLARIKRQQDIIDARDTAKPKDYTGSFVKKYGQPKAALLDAMQALFDLNRYCKHSTCKNDNRREIYGLKNTFIKLLYQSGKCDSVQRHIQTHEAKQCWSCEGFGCDRCDNTGEYSAAFNSVFLVFSFNIEGVRFTWHQPESSLDYPVKVTMADAPMPKIAAKPLTVWNGKPAKAKALVRWVIDNWKQIAEGDKQAA